MKVFNFI